MAEPFRHVYLYPEKICSVHTIDERDDLTAGADIVRAEQIGAGITGSDAVINCPENRLGIELSVFHIRERVLRRLIREPVYDLIEAVQEGTICALVQGSSGPNLSVPVYPVVMP